MKKQKIKFNQKKRLNKQLDYLIRYMIYLKGDCKEIVMNKKLLENITNSKIENDTAYMCYGINITTTDEIKLIIN